MVQFSLMTVMRLITFVCVLTVALKAVFSNDVNFAFFTAAFAGVLYFIAMYRKYDLLAVFSYILYIMCSVKVLIEVIKVCS